MWTEDAQDTLDGGLSESQIPPSPENRERFGFNNNDLVSKINSSKMFIFAGHDIYVLLGR